MQMSATQDQRRRENIQQGIKPKGANNISMEQSLHAPQRAAARTIKARKVMKKALRINVIMIDGKKVEQRQSSRYGESREPFHRWYPTFHAKQLRSRPGKLNPKVH